LSKSKTRRKTSSEGAPAPDPIDHSESIATCQRILRSLTGVMIGAFVSIVVLTTISVGDFVQFVGRGLYYAILASAVISLAVWAFRVRLERQMGKNTAIGAEVLKGL
jgi:hypothetical protein